MRTSPAKQKRTDYSKGRIEPADRAAQAWGARATLSFLHMSWELERENLSLCDVFPASHVHPQRYARLCTFWPFASQRRLSPGWYRSLSQPRVSGKRLPLYSSHSIQCLKSRRLQSHSQGFCPSSKCWRLASGSNAALSNPRSLFPARDSHLWNSQKKGDLAFAQHKILPCWCLKAAEVCIDVYLRLCSSSSTPRGTDDRPLRDRSRLWRPPNPCRSITTNSTIPCSECVLKIVWLPGGTASTVVD